MDKGTLCRVRDLSRAIETYRQSFETAFGIDLNQAVLLCHLREVQESGPGELAAALGLSGSHTSKLIAQLEAQRLIKRRLCKEDKRCMRFSLTDAGRRNLSELEAADLPLPEILQ